MYALLKRYWVKYYINLCFMLKIVSHYNAFITFSVCNILFFDIDPFRDSLLNPRSKIINRQSIRSRSTLYKSHPTAGYDLVLLLFFVRFGHNRLITRLYELLGDPRVG